MFCLKLCQLLHTNSLLQELKLKKSELVNTNKLIRTYDGATGLKTGSTSLALYNLSASATRDNLSLIAVIMRAPTPKTRFNEAKLLLDYGFNTYSYTSLNNSKDIFEYIEIPKCNIKGINLLYENDTGILTKKSSKNDIAKTVTIYQEKLVAPIKKNDVLGKIEYSIEGNIKQSVNLIASADVSRKSLNNTFTYILSKWSNFLR